MDIVLCDSDTALVYHIDVNRSDSLCMSHQDNGTERASFRLIECLAQTNLPDTDPPCPNTADLSQLCTLRTPTKWNATKRRKPVICVQVREASAKLKAEWPLPGS